MEAFARSSTRVAAATALVFIHLRGDRQKRLISTNYGQP
jgi:hypothetical protein